MIVNFWRSKHACQSRFEFATFLRLIGSDKSNDCNLQLGWLPSGRARNLDDVSRQQGVGINYPQDNYTAVIFERFQILTRTSLQLMCELIFYTIVSL